MHIASARLTFAIPENGSLKGKRQVSRALLSRLRQKFNVAAAEVDALDRWQTLVIGIGYISNEHAHAIQPVEAAIRYVREMPGDAELVRLERADFSFP